nr:FKBP-type peptidyl-prolyl cis-trans isomerase [Aliikangiella sp. G2MR2-5]
MSDQDKLAYGVGASMANNISSLNDTYKALDIDMEMVKKGFNDQIAKQSQMSEEEMMQQAQIFGQKLHFAQKQAAEEEKEAKLAENKKFLEENLNKGFTATESGLQYKLVQAAPEGAAKPAETDTVRVHYTGTFTDGKKFDSSLDRGQAFEFSLSGGVIQGWLEGVKLMEVGSKYQFVIPSDLAYGPVGRPGMPGNSILVFDIELLEIVSPEEEAQRQEG